MTLRWAVVLLAGGAGLRLGGVPKGLIHAQGKSILRRLVDAAQVLRPYQTALVTGEHHEALMAEVVRWQPALRPQVVRHPSPGADPSGSLHLGLSQLRGSWDAVMVLLTDLPLIEAADLISASTAFAQRPVDKGCVWPLVNGVPAHPVMLTAAMALELSAQPEARLRDWRMEYPERFHVWATPNAHFVRDIDEPASLVQLRQDTGLDWQLAPRVRAQGLISR